MKYLVFIVLLFTAGIAAAQTRSFTVVEKTAWHQLGDTRITVRTSTYGPRKNFVLINLHHNEATSLEAAQTVLSRKGGILIHIENGNERLISFSLNGRKFRFDPNRIFTETGIRATLAKLNETVSPAAVSAVGRFAAFIRAKIPASIKTLVAVHNNEEGDLSIESYIPGGELYREAQRVYRSPKQDADNFFLTTGSTLFSRLKAKQFNVVLQHGTRVKDDGSLSVYYARKKKVYVNVEAKHGLLDEQVSMLEALSGLMIR
jgi:hypothetical protein